MIGGIFCRNPVYFCYKEVKNSVKCVVINLGARLCPPVEDCAGAFESGAASVQGWPGHRYEIIHGYGSSGRGGAIKREVSGGPGGKRARG